MLSNWYIHVLWGQPRRSSRAVLPHWPTFPILAKTICTDEHSSQLVFRKHHTSQSLVWLELLRTFAFLIIIQDVLGRVEKSFILFLLFQHDYSNIKTNQKSQFKTVPSLLTINRLLPRVIIIIRIRACFPASKKDCAPLISIRLYPVSIAKAQYLELVSQCPQWVY